MKKLLSIILVIVMLLSVLPAGAIGVMAETTAAPAAEDFFSSATCSVGEIQSEFTNGSDTAWKLVPGTSWTYPTFDLGEKVDISKHDLIFDIYPANMNHFAMHIAHFDGTWLSYPGVYYTPNQWTTVRVNMMANGKDVTRVQKIALGTMIGADEGADYALYIDNVRLVERAENADATEETEKASDILGSARYEWSGSDWSGAGTLSYDKNSEVTCGPDSLRSWRFSQAYREGPSYARMQINLGKTYDMTNKDLVFDVKIGPDRDLTGETIGLVLYDTNWKNIFDNTNYQEPTVVATRGDWQTVKFDNSLLRAFVAEGKSLEKVLLLYLSFNFQGGIATDVYIDNMRLVDHTYGNDETDAASDLLANATVVKSSADNATYFYNHKDTTVAYGNASNGSHKFSATSAGSQYLNVRYDLGQSYDMTGKNFVMDLLAYRCSTTYQFSLYDSNNKLISHAYGVTTGKKWAENRPAMLTGLQSGMDLTDVRYLEIGAYFPAESGREDRALYVDNLRIEEINVHYTNLENANVVFMGDSITAAFGYKGWSGELQEHYGINRYNIGVGGASYANISGRSTIFAQTANIPKNVDIDFFILNGGVNDVWSKGNLGSVSDIAVDAATPDSFDTTTTAGAMEQMFCYLRTNYPDAKIGFIINYVCYDSGFDGIMFRDEFTPLAKAVCDKWDVPYLDLVNNNAFNAEFNALAGHHTYDGVHGNDLGYELVMEQMAPWMLSTYGATSSTEQDSDLLSYATYAWSNTTWNNDLRTYTNKSDDTYGPDSLRSWKFTATAASTGNHGLQINLPGYARFNLQGKAIQFDAKFESSDGKPSTKIAMNLYGHGWSNLLQSVVWTEGNGKSGWQTITMDASLFEAKLLEGKDLSEINLIWFTFDFDSKSGNDQSVTIDNFRIVDVDKFATKQTEAATDMFYGATYHSGYFENPGFGHDEHVTEIVHGDDSLFSVKLYAEDNYTAWTNATYKFPKKYNLVGKSLTIDLNMHNHVYLGISLLNSNQEVVTSDTIHPRKSGWDNIQDCGWEHYEIDLYGGLAAGKTEADLADIRYIKFSASFEYVKEGRALYFDNLQTYVNEKYDSALNGLNGLYMGDSISEAIGYKGWAGELYEHYGVTGTNVSVSGSTLASNGIYSQLSKVPAGASFDFVMLNGGVNDVWRNIALGKVSAEGTAEFDTATAIGALEHLFSTIKSTYPTAEVCYILNYTCNDGGSFPSDKFINEFAPLAREACEKWDVYCLDLVADEAFLAEFDVTAGVHTYDGIHANIDGYKVITKYVAPWLLEIFGGESFDPVETEPEVTEPEETEPEITEPEETEPEVTEPSADPGDLFGDGKQADTMGIFAGGNFYWDDASTEVYGQQSTKSWLFAGNAAAGGWPTALIRLDKSYDLTGKYLEFEVKTEGGHPYVAISNVYNSGWGGLLKADQFNISTSFNKPYWNTVCFDLSTVLGEGKDLTDVEFIRVGFNFDTKKGNEQKYWIDNVRIVDEPSVDQNDILAGANFQWSAKTWNDGNGLTWDSNYFDTYGEGSTHSWMFGGAANINSTAEYQMYLDKNYDMENAYFVFDAKVIGTDSMTVGVRPQGGPGGWTDLTNYQEVTVTDEWDTYFVDFTKLPWAGYHENGLSQVIRLVWKLGFTGTNTDRKVIIDNVRVVKNEGVEQDWIHMARDTGSFYYTGSAMIADKTYAEGSTLSMKYTAPADSTGKLTWNPEAYFGTVQNWSNGKLGAWVYFGNQEPKLTVQFTSAWKGSIPAACTITEGENGWYYCELDTSTIDFYDENNDGAPDSDMSKINRFTLMVTNGYTIYVDGLSYTVNETECKHENTTTDTVDATCTDAGSVTVICNDCGEAISVDEISPLGHKYESEVTPPTTTDKGYTTHTCSVCGDSYVDSYVDPIVLPSGDATLKFSNVDLTLASDLTITFKVKGAVFAEGAYSNPRVEYRIPDVSNNKVIEVELTEYTIDTQGRLIFPIKGISPRLMKAPIYLTLYGTYQGVEYAFDYEYAVTKYCYNQLTKATNSQQLKSLVVDLLNFGTAHQKFAGHDVDNLINADLNDEQKALASTGKLDLVDLQDAKYVVREDATAAFKAVTLVLQEAVVVRLKVEIMDLEGAYVRFTLAGKTFDISSDMWEPVAGEANRYYVFFNNLRASEMSEEILATVNRGDTIISNTLRYSIETYAARNINTASLTELLTAMMYYGKSCDAYF